MNKRILMLKTCLEHISKLILVGKWCIFDLPIQGHMQIFEKITQKALNRVLTLPDYSIWPELLRASGIIDLQNNGFCKQFKHLESWSQCHILAMPARNNVSSMFDGYVRQKPCQLNIWQLCLPETMSAQCLVAMSTRNHVSSKFGSYVRQKPCQLNIW